jgi:hypothetical protein
MPASRQIPGSRYLLLCLLLLSAGSMAGAREVRLHGPNGDGGCPDGATPAAAAPAKAATPTAAHATSKIKPVITVRGGGDDSTTSHAPRWHSFLPGMFR